IKLRPILEIGRKFVNRRNRTRDPDLVADEGQEAAGNQDGGQIDEDQPRLGATREDRGNDRDHDAERGGKKGIGEQSQAEPEVPRALARADRADQGQYHGAEAENRSSRGEATTPASFLDRFHHRESSNESAGTYALLGRARQVRNNTWQLVPHEYSFLK